MESTMSVEKSTHRVEVFQIKELIPHENADALSKVMIWDYPSCVKTSDWKVGDLAAFVVPDSVVDTTRPEFAFLANKARNGKVRIRTQRLRGSLSYGLVVKAPPGSKVGDDVAEILGVEHWQPEESDGGLLTGGEAAKPPVGIYPVYDVDSYMKWGRAVFQEGELVAVTEKLHGSSSRHLFKDGIMHCGSRTEFKREYPTKPDITFEQVLVQHKNDETRAKNAWRKFENWNPKRNLWWIALDNSPAIAEYCKANPGYAVYSECIGQVKGYHYGVTNGQYKLAAFDILKSDGTWMDFPDFYATCKKYGIPHVPVIHETFPFNFEAMVKMAEGKTLMPDNHIREGIVVHPVKERWDERVGRVKFKVINPEY